MGLDVTPIRNAFDIEGLAKFLSSGTSAPAGTALGPSVQSWPPPKMQPPYNIQQFKYGQSNPTYHISDAEGHQFVLRRKPMANANLVSRSAHAIEREFHMLRGINVCNAANTEPIRHVPVPLVYVLCEDESVIGFVFYLMEFVEGRQLVNPSMPGMLPEVQEKHWDAIMDTISAIHSLDADRLCAELPAEHFPQFQKAQRDKQREKQRQGVAALYFQRQAKSLGGVEKHQLQVVKPVPNFERLCGWLLQKAPRDPDQLTLIHGDFKIDNVLFHPTEPRVLAVLDWELCTFGHPIFDLANFLQPFQLPNKLNLMLYKPDKTDMGKEQPGALEAVYDKLRLYRQKLGHDWAANDPSNNPVDQWVVGFVFGLLRLLVILQGIAMRVAKGNASLGEASGYAAMYPFLAQLATEYINENATGARL